MADILEQDYIKKKKTVLAANIDEERQELEDRGYVIIFVKPAMNDYIQRAQYEITYGVPITEGETTQEGVEVRRVTWTNQSEYEAELKKAGIEIINKRKVIVQDKDIMRTMIEFELKTKVAPVAPGVPNAKPPLIDLGFLAWFGDMFRGHSYGKRTLAAPSSGKKLSDVLSSAKLARVSRSFKKR